MAQITVREVLSVLEDDNLLISMPSHYEDVTFDNVTYASSEVTTSSLLVCKGNFKDTYMSDASSRGLLWYVADRKFDPHYAGTAQAIIVSDTRKALALIAQAFYDYPQNDLVTVGITGTKGKSTTTYFVHAVLNQYFTNKVALISSVDNCIDGVTYVESNLTTPESLDLYRMLRQAVDAGLTHAVIEVSSQAYKVDRVYKLHFNVGAFLNIFPDHISPIEHPSFDDYFACKRQIIFNSDSMVIGADIQHRDVIESDVTKAGITATYFKPSDVDRNVVKLAIPGEFNYANAAAALAIARALGVPVNHDAEAAMNTIRISGRMEVFHGAGNDSHIHVIVDYAHNGISTTSLLDYVYSTYDVRNATITLITGSAGNKAYNRRKEIVEAAQSRISRFVFTTEDTNTEPNTDIVAHMIDAITDKNVTYDVVLDRSQAIEKAIEQARKQVDKLAIILIIGKGNERWIKNRNKHIPYEGDDHAVKRILGLL
ncbi:Mur ligase family protein [Alloscardovia venturai]|uniref:Mur ligase family protein n=1 Tax=Alloscardovia venturai TaxID=1769421 RepID=A0ABW2Y4F6_9BIFI